MAPFKQARLMSVVLLFATLAAGILIGVAWSERGRDTVPLETVQPTAQPTGTDDTGDPADSAGARSDGNRERRPPVIFELDLDPAQETELEEVRQSFIQQWGELEDEMKEEADRRERELRRAAWEATRAVLRPDQLARYDSLLTARYSRRDSIRGDGGRGNGRDRSRRPDGQENNRGPFGPKHWKDFPHDE